MSVFTHLQSFAAGECGGPGWGGVRGDVTGTGVCVNHSVEKSLHSVDGLLQLQAYNTGQTTSANRFHSRMLIVNQRQEILANANVRRATAVTI